MARGGLRQAIGHGAIVATLAAVCIGLNTDFRSPPRFDGAGYAVLAKSLETGRGYRAIDHPDQPEHAHFPPGYPLTLAAVWRLTEPSALSAHITSFACTIAATLGFWAWFRRLYSPKVALILGMALALNWTWGRTGGAIQSEPLFLLLCSLVLLVATRVGKTGNIRPGLILGVLLGACVLTRHVGACLALAVFAELLLRKRFAATLATLGTSATLVLPWIGWLATVKRDTQVGLLPQGGWARVIAGNALFYLRRVPDQITGPVVEIGTVFRPELQAGATVWATLATTLVIWGWVRAWRRPRRRLAALVPLTTFPLLLIWPFTEAGRFLIPLAPFLLIGAVEGLAPLIALVSGRSPRRWAAALTLAATIPYAGYALVTNRAEAARRTHADFDAGCAWIARQDGPDGPVMTRHPGEVYWLTDRTALPPSSDDPKAINDLLDQYGVSYLLVDEERYAREPVSPLGRYVNAHPRRLRRVWSAGGITIYAVERSPTLDQNRIGAARLQSSNVSRP
ncbi:MAG: glycosyltransferase family 39 protein [Isosphaeraceae bacterium]